MFPDVASAVLHACSHPHAADAAARDSGPSFIVDSELVAVDRAQGNSFRAFQELSTRARDAVAEADVTVHVCVFLFDALYVNGESLLHLPLRERRARLRACFPDLRPGFVELAQGLEMHVAMGGDALMPPPLARPAVVSIDSDAGSCSEGESADGALATAPAAASRAAAVDAAAVGEPQAAPKAPAILRAIEEATESVRAEPPAAQSAQQGAASAAAHPDLMNEHTSASTGAPFPAAQHPADGDVAGAAGETLRLEVRKWHMASAVGLYLDPATPNVLVSRGRERMQAARPFGQSVGSQSSCNRSGARPPCLRWQLIMAVPRRAGRAGRRGARDAAARGHRGGH